MEVVATSKNATLAEVLSELSRDRLKEMCVAFGLDDGGREKALLVERLLGTTTNGAAESTANGSAPVNAGGGARSGGSVTTSSV